MNPSLANWSRRCRAAMGATWLALAGHLPAATAPVNFSREVLPVLSDVCFQCHGPDAKARKADLRLDVEADAKRARKDGAILVPGNSAQSELMRRLVTADPTDRMPPPELKRSLTPAQIETIRRWIDEGANWGAHWAFTRVERPAPPAAGNPVDAFINARLKRAGVRPNPPASRATLIRRLFLDLTGLPPSPAAVKAFEADERPDAWTRLVAQVLAQPGYGERMAWDWLDAARYADSNGYQGDRERTMWPWRDWVVRAFNENLPWDQFTVWQLAGDLLPKPATEQILATGFCRNHMINGEGGRIADENRVDYVMDMTETMGTVWLGLTVGCARCHDHKFDPITQREYYSLFAFFDQTPVTGGGGDPQTAPVLAVPTPEQTQRIESLEREVAEAQTAFAAREKELAPRRAEWEQEQRAGKDAKLAGALQTEGKKRSKEQRELIEQAFVATDSALKQLDRKLTQSRKQLEDARKAVPKVMVMADKPDKRKSFLLTRGLYNKPAGEVAATVPAFLPALPVEAQPTNRLALARWLVSRDHPLTARVTVNRFWQMLFGTGFVKTPEDFGVQGEFPRHPELLDWLAAEFMESGWDVKRLLTLVLTSETYRRESRVTPESFERDPENRLLARGARHRMPSWMLRDQALAVSGLLNAQVGGEPVNGYQPDGIWEEATFGKKKYTQDHGDQLHRRSLYTFWRRIVGPTMFFDSAARQVCTVKTPRTNTPLHALGTLNDVTYVEAARALAERVLRETGAGSAAARRLNHAGRLVLARDLSAAEMAIWQGGLARARAAYEAAPKDAEALLKNGESKRDETIPASEHAAWTTVCLALLNSDEALNRE